MIIFALLMVVASLSMIRTERTSNYEGSSTQSINLPKLLLYGVLIGLGTGILGAGGGFLLIPALVLLIGLPMKKAIGTSLLIIALNSLIGFLGDLGHYIIDWIFLLKISLLAIAGIFIGGYIGKFIQGDKLKKGFGWFVLVMGLYIVTKETLFKQH